jgi:hypothetical protein
MVVPLKRLHETVYLFVKTIEAAHEVLFELQVSDVVWVRLLDYVALLFGCLDFCWSEWAVKTDVVVFESEP